MGASKVVSPYKISQKESEPRGVTREQEKQADIYITFWGVRGLRFELVVHARIMLPPKQRSKTRSTATYLELGVSTEKEKWVALGIENQSVLGNIFQSVLAFELIGVQRERWFHINIMTLGPGQLAWLL